MGSSPTVLTCPCKVNTYLKIGRRREDGYHEIESIFLPLPSPSDTLQIYEGGDKGLTLECNIKGLISHNILYRAYEHFGNLTGLWPSLHIVLKKNIPVGAGLGGGSSDAAHLLKYLWNSSKKRGREIPFDLIIKIAGMCGADVPFFLFDSAAYVTGIGERIIPIPIPPEIRESCFLVISPPIDISTSWAYRKWDKTSETTRPHSLTNNLFDINKPFRFWANDFESVVFREHPTVRTLKSWVMKGGARACVLSGSGSSLVALYSGQIPGEVLEELKGRGIAFFINTGV